MLLDSHLKGMSRVVYYNSSITKLKTMGFSYKLKYIEKGEQAKEAGHTVYANALYTSSNNSLEKVPKRIIFKLNKLNNPLFSCFEVAFTALARRFLRPNLTPKQFLVTDDNQDIVGVAAEHFSYVVQEREGLATFASLGKEEKSSPLMHDNKISLAPGYFLSVNEVKKAEEIPIFFLDRYDPGLFAALWQARKDNKIEFDMDSLASVLCTSYTLEEDDLHKGNFGFYIVKKLINGQDQWVVVFFKIDNDLMMADSVMSRCSSRIVNWRHGDDAFEVTTRDLISFPRLRDSQNFYWPTSVRYLANPIDKKVYSSAEEIRAFIDLGKDESFQNAKWREFYRHILVPQSIIEEGLLEDAFKKRNSSDRSATPEERAQVALIAHSVIARQARLRASLFTIPAFRKYVSSLNEKETASIIEDVLAPSPASSQKVVDQISTVINGHKILCDGGFVSGDTPLHVAIRLGDYRHHETWHSYGQYAEQENSLGEKPMDLAVSMLLKVREEGSQDLQTIYDVRRNPFFTIKSLLMNEVKKTTSYKQLVDADRAIIETYHFPSLHLNNAAAANSSGDFLKVMQAIGEDHQFSLKMKKDVAIGCMKQFITAKKNEPQYEQILLDLKVALNGDGAKLPSPEMQFIRQLRSRLWIVRIFRGLLGGTGTQVELNRLIDGELHRLNPSCSPSCFSSCFSFFFSKPEPSKNEEKSKCSPGSF